MKQPKKLTVANKKLLVKAGLDPAEWMCRFEDGLYLHIVNKETSNIKIIDKGEGVVANND